MMLRSALISNLLTIQDNLYVCCQWSRIPRRLRVIWKWDR